jgi:RNA polymerase sigma-70 factor (ECF subfamily)
LRGWLLSLMHNLYLNQVRDEGREWNHEELSEALEPAHDPFLRAPERLDLERALQVLAPQQREALLLVTVEELTYGEAATVLGVPAGTVMSRLSRARENLRKLMAGEARLAKPAALKIVR